MRDDIDDRARAPEGIVRLVGRWQAITVAGLAVVVVALAALLGLDRFVYEPRTRDVVDAISSAEAANQAMLDQQSGLRGFVATGDDVFLGSYERGRRALPAHVAELERLLGGDRAAELLDLRLSQEAWLDGFTPRALAAGRSGPGGEQTPDLLRDGKALFDRYRVAAGRLRDVLRHDRDAALGDEQRAITLAAGLALSVTLVVAVLGWWRARRLRAQLFEAVRGVDVRLRAIGAGDLTGAGADAPRSGLGEFDRIHDGLDATTSELAAGRSALERQSEEVAVHNRQLGQVLRFSREVAGSLNLRYVLRGLCTAAREIALAERVVVWVRSEDGGQLDPVADSAGPSLEPVGLEPVRIGEGGVGAAARFGRIHGLDGEVEGFGAVGGRTVAVPMVVGAEVAGVLEITVDDGASLEGSTVPVLEALAVQAATAVSAARLHEQTEVLAMTDGLTRLPNRRSLEADLVREVGISQRYGRPLAFAMIDVDHFKAYNDAFGHQAGDAALQALAHVLAGSVRAGDVAYRYGGEELAVLMRETDAGPAGLVAERLRAIVEHHFTAPGEPRAVTISVGVAAMPRHANTIDDLVSAADAALYEAKRAGRNRVVVSQAP